METEKKKTIIDKIWDIFASVTLAVILFAVIALTSVVGTILEQQAPPEKNVQVLGKMFGLDHDAAHSVLGLLDSLGFTDMYHSWWFVTLLMLFGANLIICSLDRLPRIWKLAREPIRPVSSDYLENTALKRTLTTKVKGAQAKEMVVEAMKKIGFKPSESSGETGVQVYAEKGNYTRLGVYITHASILIIMAGAIIGLFFGFNAFLNLPEGQISPVAYKGEGIEIPLGFDIRCDNFEVDFYGNSDMPKEYKSWLTVFKNGKEVMKKSIEVNDPLTYEGITFYQSSYGAVPNGMDRGVLILRVFSKDGKSEEIHPKIGDTFSIPGTMVTGRITNFSPALTMDEMGRTRTYAEQMLNPAVYIEFSEGGKATNSGWILKRYPQTWNLRDGNRVEFLDFWGVEYTGMQVRKDPGVGIVYLGCIIMAIGLYMTFFMSHKKIWVSLADEKNGSRILIGAITNKNRAAFERKIEKLVSILGTAQKGGK